MKLNLLPFIVISLLLSILLYFASDFLIKKQYQSSMFISVVSPKIDQENSQFLNLKKNSQSIDNTLYIAAILNDLIFINNISIKVDKKNNYEDILRSIKVSKVNNNILKITLTNNDKAITKKLHKILLNQIMLVNNKVIINDNNFVEPVILFPSKKIRITISILFFVFLSLCYYHFSGSIRK